MQMQIPILKQHKVSMLSVPEFNARFYNSVTRVTRETIRTIVSDKSHGILSRLEAMDSNEHRIHTSPGYFPAFNISNVHIPLELFLSVVGRGELESISKHVPSVRDFKEGSPVVGIGPQTAEYFCYKLNQQHSGGLFRLPYWYELFWAHVLLRFMGRERVNPSFANKKCPIPQSVFRTRGGRTIGRMLDFGAGNVTEYARSEEEWIAVGSTKDPFDLNSSTCFSCDGFLASRQTSFRIVQDSDQQ